MKHQPHLLYCERAGATNDSNTNVEKVMEEMHVRTSDLSKGEVRVEPEKICIHPARHCRVKTSSHPRSICILLDVLSRRLLQLKGHPDVMSTGPYVIEVVVIAVEAGARKESVSW